MSSCQCALFDCSNNNSNSNNDDDDDCADAIVAADVAVIA